MCVKGNASISFMKFKPLRNHPIWFSSATTSSTELSDISSPYVLSPTAGSEAMTGRGLWRARQIPMNWIGVGIGGSRGFGAGTECIFTRHRRWCFRDTEEQGSECVVDIMALDKSTPSFPMPSNGDPLPLSSTTGTGDFAVLLPRRDVFLLGVFFLGVAAFFCCFGW
jgi:hypothetical protein